jgi:hypothetical protein
MPISVQGDGKSRFRRDADHDDSELLAITIPTESRSLVRSSRNVIGIVGINLFKLFN